MDDELANLTDTLTEGLISALEITGYLVEYNENVTRANLKGALEAYLSISIELHNTYKDIAND